jgi:hypothetical protein
VLQSGGCLIGAPVLAGRLDCMGTRNSVTRRDPKGMMHDGGSIAQAVNSARASNDAYSSGSIIGKIETAATGVGTHLRGVEISAIA